MVNISLGISPGKLFQEHAEKVDRKRKRKSEHENSVEFKRRKLERKLQQKFDISTQAVREGPTYESGVTLVHVSDVSEIPVSKPVPVIDTIDNLLNVNKIYCDIETSSLHKDADILQIAATSVTDSFDVYILPSKQISPAASEITGLSVIGNSMFYKGQRVETSMLKDALILFVKYLKTHQPCVLIGHNFHRFDFPRIIRAFEVIHMTSDLLKCTLGTIDTLPLFRNIHPGLEKYSQEHLVDLFVKVSYSAHNALSDVKSLQQLCNSVNVSDKQMCKHSCTVQSAVTLFVHKQECQRNIDTLIDFEHNKVLSKGMMDKIGESGLCLAHLKLAVQRSGQDGLYHLLSEPYQGKPRVTKTKKIIEKLYEYLVEKKTE